MYDWGSRGGKGLEIDDGLYLVELKTFVMLLACANAYSP